MVESSPDWYAQGRAAAASCQRFLPGLVGVYVHGSAALGGMSKWSDLDILVITESGEGAALLGKSLLFDSGEPRPLELSVVTSSAAGGPKHPWPFVLHVNSADNRSQLGSINGDPDLIAHYPVVREAGIALIGPKPKDVIGATDAKQPAPIPAFGTSVGP